MSEMTQVTGTVPDWTLGWRLQRALAHADMSVQAMADELGVSRNTVSRWLNDRTAPPRTAFVKQWALRCGVPFVWLRDGASPQHGGGVRTPGTRPQRVRRGLQIAERVAEQVVTGTGMAA